MNIDTINLYNDNDITNNECPICLDILIKKDTQIMACSHKFHKKCIKTWVSIKNICPLCRYEYNPYYKCYDTKYNIIGYKITLNDDNIKFKTLFKTYTYNYKDIYRIGFNGKLIYIFMIIDNKYSMKQYLFTTKEICLKFFMAFKNKFINL